MVDEKYISPWHHCLDCKEMFGDNCPLDGADEMEKILSRMRKPDSFNCTLYLDNNDTGKE